MSEDAVSAPRTKASRFNAQRTLDDGTLMLANSFTGAVAAIETEQIPLVKRALRRAETDEDRGDPLMLDLLSNGFLIPESTNETARLNELHAHLNDPRMLQLIIMPTEDCNFRCTYCYEAFLKKAMKPPVRQRMRDYLDKTIPRLTELMLSWFGGEPLFAFEVMRELGEHARETCARYDVPLRTVITTNGYLLGAEQLAFLQRINCVFYQITLDGDAKTHDLSRHLNGGGATFDRIVENLMRLRTSDFPHHVTIRSNVHQGNVDGVERLVEFFEREFESDERFTLDLHPVWDHGDTVQQGVELLDSRVELDRLRRRALLNSDRNCIGWSAFGPGASYCYASKRNSLVIGADGMIYKCTVAFDNPVNHVGTLRDGGVLDLDADRFALWTGNDYRVDTGCQKCFYAPSCMGGACPLIRIEDGVAPCPPTKTDIGSNLTTYGHVYHAVARS
jgi:uncharacterized protein